MIIFLLRLVALEGLQGKDVFGTSKVDGSQMIHSNDPFPIFLQYHQKHVLPRCASVDPSFLQWGTLP